MNSAEIWETRLQISYFDRRAFFLEQSLQKLISSSPGVSFSSYEEVLNVKIVQMYEKSEISLSLQVNRSTGIRRIRIS